MNYAELLEEYLKLVEALKEKDYAHAANLINKMYDMHDINDVVTEKMIKP